MLHQLALTYNWMNWILHVQIVQISARLYLKEIVSHIDAILVNGVKGEQYFIESRRQNGTKKSKKYKMIKQYDESATNIENVK